MFVSEEVNIEEEFAAYIIREIQSPSMDETGSRKGETYEGGQTRFPKQDKQSNKKEIGSDSRQGRSSSREETLTNSQAIKVSDMLLNSEESEIYCAQDELDNNGIEQDEEYQGHLLSWEVHDLPASAENNMLHWQEYVYLGTVDGGKLGDICK